MVDVGMGVGDSKRSNRKMIAILSLVLLLVGAVSGYFIFEFGLKTGNQETGEHAENTATIEEEERGLDAIDFVEIPAILVSLPGEDLIQHLRFQAQVEVNVEHKSDVVKLIPRIMDVLNGYLRAIDVQQIRKSQSLIPMRAHMLRRIIAVVGDEKVRDLLIMEFVLN